MVCNIAKTLQIVFIILSTKSLRTRAMGIFIMVGSRPTNTKFVPILTPRIRFEGSSLQSVCVFAQYSGR